MKNLRNLMVALVLAAFGAFALADTVIENTESGPGTAKIQITLCTQTAFSICSMTYRGVQYVNNYDHGRQFQSASSFDGLGESFNPTQSGSAANGVMPSATTSVLQGWWTASEGSAKVCSVMFPVGNVLCKNQLATQSQMAYWYAVGGTALSNHILNNNVIVGWNGLSNVIQYLSQFNMPGSESHTHAVLEAFTGYMPTSFSTFYTLDVKGGATSLVALSDGPGEQSLPVVFSTTDGQHALGVYSPDSPQSGWPTVGYGRFRFGDTVKWNNVFRYNNPVAGSAYNLRTYIVIGTLEEVRTRMISFRTMF